MPIDNEAILAALEAQAENAKKQGGTVTGGITSEFIAETVVKPYREAFTALSKSEADPDPDGAKTRALHAQLVDLLTQYDKISLEDAGGYKLGYVGLVGAPSAALEDQTLWDLGHELYKALQTKHVKLTKDEYVNHRTKLFFPLKKAGYAELAKHIEDSAKEHYPLYEKAWLTSKRLANTEVTSTDQKSELLAKGRALRKRADELVTDAIEGRENPEKLDKLAKDCDAYQKKCSPEIANGNRILEWVVTTLNYLIDKIRNIFAEKKSQLEQGGKKIKETLLSEEHKEEPRMLSPFPGSR